MKARLPLHNLGWIEGQNLLIERRYAEGVPGQPPALAAELVRLPVDVIVAVSNAEVADRSFVVAWIDVVFG